MKHPRGKLSSHEIPPGEISVFGYLMGPQNKKPITFLKIVTSYETPRGKRHYKVLTKCFYKKFLCLQVSLEALQETLEENSNLVFAVI